MVDPWDRYLPALDISVTLKLPHARRIMPILDVELVQAEDEAPPAGLAAALADAAGRIFKTRAGGTWVRVRTLPRGAFAENETPAPLGWQAVFVTVLKARNPSRTALAREMRELAAAVATLCRRRMENVHILYDTPAMGRIGFGGRLGM